MADKIINAAGGLVSDSKGRFLMIFRRGFWDLPKGKHEDGESIEQCAVREVSEETGLRESAIALGEFICMTVHHYEMNGEQIEKHTHWYRMEYTPAPGEELKPQTEEDIASAVWASRDEVKTNLGNTFDTIREVFRKAGIGC